MAKRPTKKAASSYKTVGKTYDGVSVLAPKTKSKTFTASQVKRAIEKALVEVSSVSQEQPLRESDSLRVKKRPDGRFEVKKPGSKRASAIRPTQGEALDRARELDPDHAPIAKRVRKSPVGKRGTWRKA